MAQAFRLACGHQVGMEMVRQLEARTRGRRIWKALRLLPRGLNGAEQLALLQLLLLPGSLIQEVHPHELGFPVAIVQRPSRWWVAVWIPDLQWAVFPQVHLAGPKGGTRRVDFLVLTPRRAPVALELDGPSHRPEEDRRRDLELEEMGLRTVRFRTWEVERKDWADRLKARLSE